MNSDEELARVRYETLHFGFPAESVLLGVKETVFNAIEDNISSLRDTLLKKLPKESEQIKTVAQELIDEYTAESVKPLEMAEKQVRQCFAIPDHVLLPGDEVQRQQFTKEEQEALNNKLESLKARYKRAVSMEKMLQAEKKVLMELGKVEFENLRLEKLMFYKSTAAELVDKLLLEVTPAALNEKTA